MSVKVSTDVRHTIEIINENGQSEPEFAELVSDEIKDELEKRGTPYLFFFLDTIHYSGSRCFPFMHINTRVEDNIKLRQVVYGVFKRLRSCSNVIDACRFLDKLLYTGFAACNHAQLGTYIIKMNSIRPADKIIIHEFLSDVTQELDVDKASSFILKEENILLTEEIFTQLECYGMHLKYCWTSSCVDNDQLTEKEKLVSDAIYSGKISTYEDVFNAFRNV
jgi:hypothetical protein